MQAVVRETYQCLFVDRTAPALTIVVASLVIVRLSLTHTAANVHHCRAERLRAVAVWLFSCGW